MMWLRWLWGEFRMRKLFRELERDGLMVDARCKRCRSYPSHYPDDVAANGEPFALCDCERARLA